MVLRSDSHPVRREVSATRPERVGGGYDYTGIHSIAVSEDDPDDVIVGASCGGVWRTRDGGESWAQCAHGMFHDFNLLRPRLVLVAVKHYRAGFRYILAGVGPNLCVLK